MPGFIDNGLPQLPFVPGNGLTNVDTLNPQGENPASGAVNLLTLSILMSSLHISVDKTTVAGTRYYTNVVLGTTMQFTGIGVLIGSTGGTDKWIVEVHNAAGTLLATSNTTGVTVGTANTYQYFPFQNPNGTNLPILLTPGTYFIVVQSNGTTAKLAVLDNPNLGSYGVVSGSATGSFGTGASITPPTTYTADLAPKAFLYQ